MRKKETAAEEKKRVDDEKRERELKEELVQARKALVHKAQPIRSFKPILIKRSDKKTTSPVTPHLGVARAIIRRE